MNETVKTAIFMVVALVALGLGIVTHLPPSEEGAGQDFVGQRLFDDFKDPAVAKSLEIVQYDPESLTPTKRFKVAQEKGLWVIPSKENYPADASQQLADAASAIMNATQINVVGNSPSDHETYGVIDPTDSKAKAAADAENVGMRVTMADRSGKKLADLIIGKAVKEKPDQRYVRRPGQDAVLLATIQTAKLSSKFQDWIEKDLLKLTSWDVTRLAIDDYSVDLVQQEIKRRNRISLRFEEKAQKWELANFEVFDRDAGDYQPEKLADDEEINTQKVNELKAALDDLQIIGVLRKPAGLAADLKAGEELMVNLEAKKSLAESGFYLVPVGDGQHGLFSNEGEVRCGTKEGVEYMLRFGSLAFGDEEGKPKADEDEGEPKPDGGEEPADETKGDEAGANRYIMLTVDFNEDLIAKPELQPLPGESIEKEAEPAADDEKTSRNASPLSAAEGLLALADGDDGDEADADADDTDGDKAKPAAKKPAAKSAKPKAAKSAKPKAAKPAAKTPKTPAELERDRIVKENERKQKEYDDKVTKGRDKVKQLSERFGDWYYVISNDTYKKIHLGRNDIIKEKAPAPGSTPDILSEEEKDLTGGQQE